MSKWVMMQLDKGKLNDKQVVPASAIGETWFPHSILGNGGKMYNSGHFELYGLGWEMEEYCGKKIVSHTGGVNGFVTSVTLLPEEKLGIVVLTNTDQNYFYEGLKWEIADAYLGKEYRNYSKVYLGYYKQQKEEESKADQLLKDSAALQLPAALPLSAYAGGYANEVYGEMKVFVEGDNLVMKFSHHPNMQATLQPLGGNRFYATFSDPEFSKAVFPFTVVNGAVKSVTVKVADFIEYNPYEFLKAVPKKLTRKPK
jgi:CubicO group peptidase (beta-lactamase class C family)